MAHCLPVWCAVASSLWAHSGDWAWRYSGRAIAQSFAQTMPLWCAWIASMYPKVLNLVSVCYLEILMSHMLMLVVASPCKFLYYLIVGDKLSSFGFFLFLFFIFQSTRTSGSLVLCSLLAWNKIFTVVKKRISSTSLHPQDKLTITLDL